MGKKDRKKRGDDDDWEEEAAVELPAGPEAAEEEEEGRGRKKEKKKTKGGEGDSGEAAEAEAEADDFDFGVKKGKKGKKGKGGDDDDDDAAAKKGGKKGKAAAAEEAEETLDFGKKKGKKGKKGRGDDDDGDDGAAEPPAEAEDDFDFGKKGKKGKEKKGKEKKGGKADSEQPDPTLEAAGKVVCAILDVRPHADAKKLQVCSVDGGDELGTLTVVCGATNLLAGMLTVLAPAGATVATPDGGKLPIKAMAVRGERSEGMLCGLGELGELPAGTPFPTEVVELDDAEPGAPFDVSMLPSSAQSPAKGGKGKKGGKPPKEEEEELDFGGKKGKKGKKKGKAGGDDDEEEEAVAPVPRDALAAWLCDTAKIGEEDAEVYAAALKALGVDAVEDLEEVEDGDWPSVIKPLHLKKIQKSLGAAPAPLAAPAPAPKQVEAVEKEEEEEEDDDDEEEEGTQGPSRASAMAALLMNDDDGDGSGGSDDDDDEPAPVDSRASAMAAALMDEADAGAEEAEKAEEEEAEEVKAAPAAADADGLRRWLLSLSIGEAAANAYQAALRAEGFASPAAVQSARLTAASLRSLGVRRGHVNLLAAPLGFERLPPRRVPLQQLEVPQYDFGATRRVRRGPAALAFPEDEQLPLFFFGKREVEVQVVEQVVAEEKEAEPTSSPQEAKEKKKKKEKENQAEAEEVEEAEFDFGAVKKKKPKPKGEAEVDPELEFDFGAVKKKKKKAKDDEPEPEAEFTFSPAADLTTKPKKKKAPKADDDEGGASFDFGSSSTSGGEKSKSKKSEGKQADKGGGTKAEASAEAKERAAREAAEMEALMAELEAPKSELNLTGFSLANLGAAHEDDDADADADADAAAPAAASSSPKKGKGPKQEELDDEDALLAAAIAENEALTGQKASKKDKKKKKKGGKGAEEAEPDDEDELLNAALAEAAAAKAQATAASNVEADEGEAGGEDGDEGDGEGKGLTKAQKKKLKEKAKKAAAAAEGIDLKKEKEEKEKEKKKPSSKLAQKLREEQERRLWEESAAQRAAELTEEATRLFRCLDVLGLSDVEKSKLKNQLNSADVAKEVEQLLELSVKSVEEFAGYDHMIKVDSIVHELSNAMSDYLKREEARRKRREREKERQERLREEGKLLTKAERAKATKQAAFLASLGKSDASEPEAPEKKKVVYTNRKKPKPKKEGDDVGAEGDAVGAEGEAAERTQEGGEHVENAPAAAEAAGGEAGAEPEEEQEWDNLNDEAIEAKVIASGIKGEEWSDEEEFVPQPSEGWSSRMAALQKEQEEAKKRKEEVLDKLYNFKKPEDDDENNGEENDSDSSDDDDGDEDEIATLKANARAEREQRAAAARATMTPERLRSTIVCIMGHVDTGKTKLLDNIRRTHVQDGEAGGITQQIGASFFPAETLRERMGSLLVKRNIQVKVPGVMIIDTPGHESFSNLRSRGSSLCDIAILVIDIMHGLEPQTIESLHMLRSKKTPFVVALNKVDRLYGWKTVKDRPFVEALEAQDESVQQEFEHRTASVLLALSEQGLNAQLYYRNKDFREYVSLIPTSAITGEGVPDILMLLVQLSQKMLVDRIMWCPEVQCTVLEVKVVEGLGATADVILANGTLRRGDRIVMCGFSGPVVTKVRELLTPKPLREIRVKTDYVHHEEVHGAMGIKICANHLERVVAGSACMVTYPDVPYDLEVLKEDVMGDLNKLAKAASEVNGGIGVYAIASTLGSLEALLEFLKTSKIPVSAVNIGPIHKKDVIKASIMTEHRPEYATILAFDVPVTKEAADIARELNVKVFTAEIIYHLFDKFTAYMADVRKKQQEEAALTAVFPMVAEISSPEHVWCRGGGGDPILVGMHVKEGVLKKGTPICVERRGQRDPTTGLQAYLDIGRVIGIEINRKPVEQAKAGQSASVKIDAVNGVLYGRQFDHTYPLYSRITRKSIDALKEFFKEDLSKEDLTLVVRLKKMFGVI